ncbi:type IV toxin-antitoxin system AbiEi family antitoxin domain-containing protein [Nocardioides sp. Root151]|uniref:type IV toxin-antitoxin system AbiEi family antitoxin domain-containing protein n=1 Tax=Nocardioides sp. Root151 TaxID=1736475 RepID=UPI0007030523|nr:type IV toxin-antitoxin system AbiEi family antitoxin domain-containing protein [Nocardioides sp. Root151]KQZ66766.1 hypothetical protein ASD66_17155 [Nocardioides sp. Root151]
MRPDLAIHANLQHGLVTRIQAMAAGYTERELRTLTGHGGAWVTVRRGVYVARNTWESLDDREGKPRLRVLAAHLTMNRPHAVSHRSAGLLHGLPMLEVDDTLVHVTRPGVTGSRTEHGVKHHLAHFAPDQVVDLNGVHVLDLARTAVDIGREHGYRHGLVACDSAMQLGATKNELWTAVDAMEHWPHVVRSRSAVQDSDSGAESVGETLARELVQSLGLGPVQTQFSVVTNGHVYWVDMRVGRHLIEFDGRVKYRGRAEGGVANLPAGEVVWAEKKRQESVCAEGYGMSRLIWADFWGDQRASAAARVRREFAITTTRFGTDLPPGYVPIPRHPVQRSA